MFILKSVIYKDILDIDYLKIEKNKITSITGESGSGKTTLLRLLNKMISPDGGSILFNGEDIESINSVELRRKVAMLSQSPVIFEGNVRDNLLMGLKFSEKNLASDETLIDILKSIHLKKSLDENPSNFSGGEKQRLALGRIIVMNPDVFLLDEPSSALDDDTAKDVISSLCSYVKANNKTLIMISHSKALSREFSDEIVELKNINSEKDGK
ncbi:putative ABC transport system ATP-binding protein [Acetoanaerobium pronyense]|uniref:ABC transport system ATP-binding protein n=1 Tax=Acetoanaerobium pronyense TaxID=1482736 RepID=A0ABS4KM61_9FIRM|nr:ABC transporter ATP-binding protein [Acetoanaerobium pronyense]MBP2028872.1 putative ABC transport system ATP-binding protein [Acetoanaerobium pronyense]